MFFNYIFNTKKREKDGTTIRIPH